MTDKKQIITDGVDVSRYTYVVCKATCKNTDCYYKQLQRKTQECEALKTLAKKYLADYFEVNKKYEELKEENQRLEMQLCNDCGERDDYNIPCKMIRDLDCGLQMELEENARYRKALEKIAKIVAQDRNIKDIYFINTCLESGRVAYDIQQQIIDIIDKAKGRKT